MKKKTIVEFYTSFLIKKRWMLLIIISLLSLILLPNLKNITFDNSFKNWLSDNDPLLLQFEQFKDKYGNNDDTLILWLDGSKGIFTQKFLRKLDLLTKKIESHKYVKKVYSLTSAPYIGSNQGDLVTGKMLSLNFDKSIDLTKFKRRINSSKLWKKLLLSKNKESTVILIEPVVNTTNTSYRLQLQNDLRRMLKGERYRLAGFDLLRQEVKRLSLIDSRVFFSIACLILLLLLYFFFKSFRIVLAAFMTIILGIIIFFGIYVLSDQSLNLITTVIPSLIIILGTNEVVHYYSHFETSTFRGKKRLFNTLKHVSIPCLFTTLTTGIGFLSLLTSPLEILQNFGMFSAIGMMIIFVITAIICTIFLNNYSMIERKISKGWIEYALEKIIKLNQDHCKKILFISILLMIFIGYGITKIKVETFGLNFLLDKNQVKKDLLFVQNTYGGYFPLDLRIVPLKTDSVQGPLFLEKLDMFQNQLTKNPKIERAFSLVDLVKQLNKVLSDNKESSYKIPDSKEAVAQALFLYEIDNKSNIDLFADRDYRESRLTFRIQMSSSTDLINIVNFSRKMAKDIFGDYAKMIIDGATPLYVKMVEYLVISQIRSSFFALLVIFIMIGLLFKSFKMFFIGMFANIVPIIITLGIMGYLKINLDIATVTIAAIAIGVAVDDTIHFLFFYTKLIREGHSAKKAIRMTTLTTGRAITITSIIVSCGYCVMLLSNVSSIIYFGLLTALAMIAAWFCDLFLLPSFLLIIDGRKK